ncbi:MAG TPA: tetratricopeptide repeat protein [Verrucomicrobiae bacterium]
MHKLTHWISPLIALVLLASAGAGCTAKVKASHYLKRAERYYDAGQYQLAELEYENVLRNDPNNHEAWDRLGIIYFDEGRVPEAIPILRKAEQLDPANLDVRLKLGAAYLEFGKGKDAYDEADDVLSNRPRDARAPLLLADSVPTNDLPALALRFQKMQQGRDSAPLEVAQGTLAFRRHDFKTAEACFKQAVVLDPKSSDAYTALGTLYLSQKDLKQADQAFQTSVQLAPPWSENGVRYGQFKIMTGDPGAGQRVLQDVVDKTPGYLPAWLALAQLSAAENNYTNALATLDNVLSRDPQNFDGLLLQSRLQLLEGQTVQAITGYKRMTKIYPQAPTIRYALAQAYLANNQTNEADESLTEALSLKPDYTDAILLRAETEIIHGDPATAIVSLRQLIQQQPQIIRGWLLLAEAYRAQGTPNDAIQTYRELENSYPESPQIPVLLGRLYFQQDQKANSRAELEKALKLQPDYLPAVEQLVDLDLAEKQYNAAFQQVQQLAVKNPNGALLQLLLGTTLAAQGETNEAESALSKAISLQPNSQAAYLLLAQLYNQAGQNQKALDELQLALVKDQNDFAALMLKGIIYNSENDYDNARDAYQDVLAIAPANGMALNNLACIYADHLNQLDKAYPLARQAHDLAPTDPYIADTLGWILYRRGQYTSALILLRQSVDKLSVMPEIQFHLGMTCYMAGYETEAATAFQQALQSTGDFPEKDDCRQHLAVLNIDARHARADTQAWLEKWTADHPDDLVALERLGAIYEFSGKSDKALAAYQAILNVNPQNVPALLSLARLDSSIDIQKAYQLARSAYDLNPNDPQTSQLLGHLALATGNYPWALTALELSIRAQPQNPEVNYDLSWAYYSMGKVPEARTAMQNALQAQNAFSHTDDAKRFLAMTSTAGASVQAQAAEILKTMPNYVPALMVKAGMAKPNGDTSTAQQTYQEVLKFYPDFAPAQKDLAILYTKNPDNDSQAYPLAVKAREAFPSDPAIAKCLGVIVCRQGDYTRAAALLQESARQLNRDPELLYYLGVAHFHLNNNAESKANLQQALSLDLTGKDAADARHILAEIR